MILSNNVVDAEFGNVEDLGEFKIRNSAKAFSILSSGLYGNKIRAVIRELSTNAVDSHIACGKENIPIEVHLPTALEPYFAVQDFGIGLSHSQVANLYTTYFESTKTESNDFIGALGLGSKSPFSYTENFTVIAVKDGYRGVYTAYINNAGIPSIALMHLEAGTSASNGVTVQLSVENQNDFYKFANEASTVFDFFQVKPTITGKSDFQFNQLNFAEKDIIPGVHLLSQGYTAKAVMGNILYPIDLPNSNKALGNLDRLLQYPLVMHFEIGELDFQANREGLQYIPLTINSIKKKLEALNNQLVIHVASKVDSIDNVWNKADALSDLYKNHMFQPAIKEYCVNTKFPYYKSSSTYWKLFDDINLSVESISSKYNISLSGFELSYNRASTSTIRPRQTYKPNSYDVIGQHFEIPLSMSTAFVITDTKVGAGERAKHHFLKAREANSDSPKSIFVLTPSDPLKSMDTENFFKDIYNPPNVFNASVLTEIPRKVKSTSYEKVGVLKIVKSGEKFVWKSAGTVADLENSTVYYIPLSGYTPLIKDDVDVYDLARNLRYSPIEKLRGIEIVGVRKSEIKAIEGKKNWVNLEKFIISCVKQYSNYDIISISDKLLDNQKIVCYPNKQVNELISENSEFRKLNSLVNYAPLESNWKLVYSDATWLCNFYKPGFNYSKVKDQLEKVCNDVLQKYPLLAIINHKNPINPEALAQYINLIDSIKE